MSHYDEAVRALARADYIANADNWSHEGRAQDVANKLAEAQVHATLSFVEALMRPQLVVGTPEDFAS